MFRKLTTLALTVWRCRSWPAVVAVRLGLRRHVDEIRLRNGMRLRPKAPLRTTWGEVFGAAIADIYHIRGAAPGLIVDVGANVGAFACLAGAVHPTADLVCYEPLPEHVHLLRHNLGANGVRARVVERPVTRDGRPVDLWVTGFTGSAGMFGQSGGTPIAMASVTLDDIDFARYPSVFFKLDCEGAEGEIVTWIAEHEARLPARVEIAAEYHHWCPVSADDLLAMLRRAGFAARMTTEFEETYLRAERRRRQTSEPASP